MFPKSIWESSSVHKSRHTYSNTENLCKGRCKSPCADINAQVIVTWVSLVSRGMNILFKFSMLSSIHSLPQLRAQSMTLAARPLHNVNIIWSLMKLENSRDCSSSAHGGGARLGAGSCCLGWKLASARSGQLKLLPRCGSDLVTNLITDAQQFFSTWSDNWSSDEHFETLRIFYET